MPGPATPTSPTSWDIAMRCPAASPVARRMARRSQVDCGFGRTIGGHAVDAARQAVIVAIRPSDLTPIADGPIEATIASSNIAARPISAPP